MQQRFRKQQDQYHTTIVPIMRLHSLFKRSDQVEKNSKTSDHEKRIKDLEKQIEDLKQIIDGRAENGDIRMCIATRAVNDSIDDLEHRAYQLEGQMERQCRVVDAANIRFAAMLEHLDAQMDQLLRDRGLDPLDYEDDDKYDDGIFTDAVDNLTATTTHRNQIPFAGRPRPFIPRYAAEGMPSTPAEKFARRSEERDNKDHRH